MVNALSCSSQPPICLVRRQKLEQVVVGDRPEEPGSPDTLDHASPSFESIQPTSAPGQLTALVTDDRRLPASALA